MHIAIMILGAIAAIFIVVLIHELGHFFVARLCGVRVIKFSIGFGKALCSYTSKKTGTEYAISMIPLGGYVKMYGEQPDEPLTAGDGALTQAYSQKPTWQRMAIALAGPLANMALAVAMFFLVYFLGVTYVKPIVGGVIPHSIAAKAGVTVGEQIIKINQQDVYGWEQVVAHLLVHIGDKQTVSVTTQKNGQIQQRDFDLSAWALTERNPDILQNLGFLRQIIAIPPLINSVMPGSPAAVAGMQAGDVIIKMNHQPVSSWLQFLQRIRQQPNKIVSITVRRHGIERSFKLHIGQERADGKVYGHIGAQVQWPAVPAQLLHTVRYGFVDAIKAGMEHTWNLFVLNLKIVGKMFVGSVSVNTLGGPISMFKAAGQASQAGLSIYLSFIGFVSVALGFINLLPIPMLDGGHVLFQLIEMVARKPVPLRYQMWGLKLGVVVIVWLMLQATFNDILRLV